MKTAFDNVSGPVFVLTPQLVRQGLEASRESPRKRILLPIHRRQEARVQRMLNFLQPGTYIRPHRHTGEHAVESIDIRRGSIKYFVFDEKGDTEQVIGLSEDTAVSLIDIEPGVWHSFVVTQPDTVLFEVKAGPYDEEADKEFADWAPAEYTPEADRWVESMLQSRARQ